MSPQIQDTSAVLTVTQVNQYIKGLLDRDDLLSGLFVRGEISNYKAYPSGHHYFSLKDAEGAIRCVMFKREALSLRFRPTGGWPSFPGTGSISSIAASCAVMGWGTSMWPLSSARRSSIGRGSLTPLTSGPSPGFPKRLP